MVATLASSVAELQCLGVVPGSGSDSAFRTAMADAEHAHMSKTLLKSHVT